MDFITNFFDECHIKGSRTKNHNFPSIDKIQFNSTT